MTSKVKLGKKGQITIPKKIRDEDNFEENDTFIVTHTPGGDIVMRKIATEDPIDQALAILDRVPHFDWRKAWEEVREERKKSDR